MDLDDRKKNNIFVLYSIIMFFLSWPLGWWGVLFFLFSIGLGYFLLYYKPKTKEENVNIKNYLLIIPILIFLISRFLPFVLYGPHPLGYDTGFYNYNIEKERAALEEGSVFSPLTKLAEVESIGSGIINRILIAVGFSNWNILYLIYILAGAFAGFMIFLLSRLYFGKNAALFSALIYNISFTQYLAYWEMFWKNAIGVALILLVFYLFESKNKAYYFLPWIIIFFLFITHKTSAFILFISLFIYFLLSKKKNKYIFLFILSILALIVAWTNKGLLIYLWEEVISGFTAHYDFFSVKEGIFIDGQQFLKYSFYYLPFALLGILEALFLRKKNLTLILFFVCLIAVIIKFIFYKRFFVFLDISLIIFSGLYIYEFINKGLVLFPNKLMKILLSTILLVLTFLFFSGVKAQQPMVSRNEIKSIKEIKSVYPDLRVFTYNSYYTPWLYGFSGHKIIAPGWGDLIWNLEKWNIFWASNQEAKKKMMAEFNQPLIIYLYNDFFSTEKDECFEKINNNFYLFNCIDK
jgi:hypothetical protein